MKNKNQQYNYARVCMAIVIFGIGQLFQYVQPISLEKIVAIIAAFFVAAILFNEGI